MTLYPSAANLYWIAISLLGVSLNVALIWMAVQGVRFARSEGGLLSSQATSLLVRIGLRATTHLVNLTLGVIGLVTPPAPATATRPPLQGFAILVGLFAVQILLVADAVVDLFSRRVLIRRLMREE